jgi:hypothetical protein
LVVGLDFGLDCELFQDAVSANGMGSASALPPHPGIAIPSPRQCYPVAPAVLLRRPDNAIPSPRQCYSVAPAVLLRRPGSATPSPRRRPGSSAETRKALIWTTDFAGWTQATLKKTPVLALGCNLFQHWTPACAGATGLRHWTPACAGVTASSNRLQLCRDAVDVAEAQYIGGVG